MAAPSSFAPFSLQRKQLQLDRAAAHMASHPLWRMATQRLAERLADEMVDIFPRVAEIGCRTGELAELLQGKVGQKRYIQLDLSANMLQRNMHPAGRAQAHPEWLPLLPHSVDLVASVFCLHWLNDIPGVLAQIHRSLDAGGALVATVFGAQSLTALREVLMQAELEEKGGAALRMAPLPTAQDMAGLLQRAGFIEPVTHSETVTMLYENMWDLMHDLRAMGENAAMQHASALHLATVKKAEELYRRKYARPDGSLPASFEIIELVGWKK